MENKYPQENSIYNLGTSFGETSDSLLERIEFETRCRIREKGRIIFVFQIGSNDSAFLRNKKDFWIKQDKFRDNIREIIKKSKLFSKNIFFVGSTPVDEDKTHPIPWDKRVTYKNEYIKKYNEIIKSICQENDIKFIEIFEDWVKSDYKIFLEDGVHPNSEGHEKIFELVRDFLVEKKII